MNGRKLLISALFLCLAISGLSRDTERQYLSGRGKDDPVPWRFSCTEGRQSGYWTNLPVPSNWECFGFGSLSYHRDVTNAPVEQGRYEREFQVPGRWADRRVFLVFDGVMTDVSVRVNGQPAGPTHQGGFYRFKYELTPLLRFGRPNQLEVVVDKKSANASVNQAERKGDYWMFGGIFRPVWLEAQPPQFIERVAVDARGDGAFAMDVFVNGCGQADTVEAQITTLEGVRVGLPFAGALPGRQATLKTTAASPRAWSAETPDLYWVEVRLKSGGKVVHRYRQRFGFRTFEVRDGDGFYLNGRRVVLKGANRHSFWPDTGRCLSAAVHRLDIRAMKEMNMNAVRMSHYPPDAEFLDGCDELGLYVLDELGGWHWAYDTEVGRKLVEEMVTRDVNHPSILFWDNGNEGGFNTNVDHVFAEFDPQRRRVLHPWVPFSGVNTAHYLAYENAVLACQGVHTSFRDNKEVADTKNPAKYIYLPTEFMHGLYDGGAGAGLEDYWRLMERSKYLGGGFIWALMDEGLNRDGVMDVAGNQAPDGILGPYRQREGSFYTIKELWAPIEIAERELPADFTGQLTVENKFSFTEARECGFEWELRKFPKPGQAGAGFKKLAGGRVLGPSIPPGGKGRLQLELPKSWGEADALALTVRDPSGRELWTWVWPVPGLRRSVSSLVPTRWNRSAASVTETEDEVAAKNGSFTVAFHKRTGLVSRIERGRQRFSLANGPRPARGSARLSSLETAVDGDTAVVTAWFSEGLRRMRWRVMPDGWAACDYTAVAEESGEFPGVAFDYPEDRVRSKRWLGQGPYRVWQNRLRGTTLNVWQNDYNNTITGWSDWVYPEFKGCFAGVYWMELRTSEGPITLYPQSQEVFVQVLRPGQPPAALRGKTDFSLPEAGLALLHAIPPVGTKFKPADQGGPQGQPRRLTGEVSGSVTFHFGK
jgi:hypothetical protein